jgi:hypothetical protein
MGNLGEIVFKDPSRDSANGYVAKLLLQVNGDFYSVEFASDVELAAAVRKFFLKSPAFNDVEEFLGTALRNGSPRGREQRMIGLAGESGEWLRFIRQHGDRRLDHISSPA